MTYQESIDKRKFRQGSEIYSWIRDLTQWGHRKTGTPQGRRSAEYIEEKMKEFGLSDVRIEKVPSMCMTVEDYSLEIEGRKMDSFYINGTNRGGHSGRFSFGGDGKPVEFVYVGQGRPEDFEKTDVSGKVAVVSIFLPESEEYEQAGWFDEFKIYDPLNQLQEKKKKVDIYTPDIWPNNFYLAQTHGAVGFVGILENYMDDPYFYNEDYTENGQSMGCEYMSLPALWTSRSCGREIKAMFAKSGVLKGRMAVDTTYQYKDGLNIVGELKGKSDDIILIHSHHDAVFEGAVQDASGVSEVLALAKYFSQFPPESREKTLMFAALDTHYTDYAANIGFIRRRAEEGDNIQLDIAIEHVGKEAVFDDDFNLYETGQVEPRLFYVSKPELYDFTAETISHYDLKKSLIASVPVGKGLDGEYVFHKDEVVSDAFYTNESGIPVVSMVCGEQYLFHISDKPDRIPVEELQPVGMAFAEIAGKAMEIL
ncbi:MAG: M28 family peptidase [Anaerovoracaceae bacterium]|jgi:hypothetical protein